MLLLYGCVRRTSLRIATQNSLARKSQACAPRAAIGCHSPACVSPRRTRGRPGPRCCQRRGSAGAANGVVTVKKVDFSCREQDGSTKWSISSACLSRYLWATDKEYFVSRGTFETRKRGSTALLQSSNEGRGLKVRYPTETKSNVYPRTKSCRNRDSIIESIAWLIRMLCVLSMKEQFNLKFISLHVAHSLGGCLSKITQLRTLKRRRSCWSKSSAST